VDADAPILDLNALLTASEAAAYTGRSVQVIVNWRNRGRLPIATDSDGREIRDNRGRPLYRLLDVAKADAGALRRAEQMVRNLQCDRKAA
jgi:hypothetical protein